MALKDRATPATPLEQLATACEPAKRHGKPDAERRIADLCRERNNLREEVQKLEAINQSLDSEVRKLSERLRASEGLQKKAQTAIAANDTLLERLAGYEGCGSPAAVKALIASERLAWERFQQRCKAANAEQALQAVVGHLPSGWVRLIRDLPGGPQLVIYMAANPAFLEYLNEFKPDSEVALTHLLKKACELTQGKG